MSKALAKTSWTPEQLKLITNTVAKGSTPDELQLFLYTAKRTGLDPLTKQIHFVKRGGQMTVQTGIDGYRAIAERTGQLAGIDDAIFDTEKEVHPNKATVTVWRMVGGQRVSFTATARWREYAPVGSQAFMWNKMPYLMLSKCAEALALRKAFPNDLTGIYTYEEMHQADNKSSSGEEKNKASASSIERSLEMVNNSNDIKELETWKEKILISKTLSDEDKTKVVEVIDIRVKTLQNNENTTRKNA